MSWRGRRYLNHPGPRRAPDWYDQSDEETVLSAGDRVFIVCEGGPSFSHMEVFPPRTEVAEKDGLYVLIDVGPPSDWKYVFVPRRP